MGKSATLRLVGDGLRFDAVVDSGHTIVVDDDGGNAGPRPTELLVASLGACTAMDVISILRKKRQRVTGYEVRLTSDQRGAHPYAFLAFRLIHEVTGEDVDPEAVRRSVELSATRYCAVGSTLSTGALTITHTYVVRAPDGREVAAGDVVVTGPNQLPRDA